MSCISPILTILCLIDYLFCSSRDSLFVKKFTFSFMSSAEMPQSYLQWCCVQHVAYTFFCCVLGLRTSLCGGCLYCQGFFFLLSKMFLLKGKQMYAFEYCFCTSIVTMAPAAVQNHSFRGTVRRVRCRLSLQTYIYSKGLQGFSS